MFIAFRAYYLAGGLGVGDNYDYIERSERRIQKTEILPLQFTANFPKIYNTCYPHLHPSLRMPSDGCRGLRARSLNV